VSKISGLQRPQISSQANLFLGAKVKPTRWNHSVAIAPISCVVIILLVFSGAVSAQQPPAANPILAGAGSPQSTTGTDPAQTAAQSTPQDDSQKKKSAVDETVGVLSRKSIFFPELATNRNPLTSGQKFKLFVDRTISPSTFVSAAFSAAEKQAFNTYPGYGQGWDAYGKRYGAAIANSASTNLFGTFIFPSLFHQDPRHFFYNRPGFGKKVEYALTRQFVTRADSGRNTFNLSRVLSVFVAEAIANSYLPPEERTVARTFVRSGERFAFGIGTTFFREYWPDIMKKLGRPYDRSDGSPD
jgi:hypothetical protein